MSILQCHITSDRTWFTIQVLWSSASAFSMEGYLQMVEKDILGKRIRIIPWDLRRPTNIRSMEGLYEEADFSSSPGRTPCLAGQHGTGPPMKQSLHGTVQSKQAAGVWSAVGNSAAVIRWGWKMGPMVYEVSPALGFQRFLWFWVSMILQVTWRKVFTKESIIIDFALWQAKFTCIWSDRKRNSLSQHSPEGESNSTNDSEVPHNSKRPTEQPWAAPLFSSNYLFAFRQVCEISLALHTPQVCLSALSVPCCRCLNFLMLFPIPWKPDVSNFILLKSLTYSLIHSFIHSANIYDSLLLRNSSHLMNTCHVPGVLHISAQLIM